MIEYVIKAWNFLIKKSKPVLVLIILAVVIASYFYIPFAWKNKIDIQAQTKTIEFQAQLLMNQDSIFKAIKTINDNRISDKEEMKTLIQDNSKAVVKLNGDLLTFLVKWSKENKELLIEHIDNVVNAYNENNVIIDTKEKSNIKREIKVIKK